MKTVTAILLAAFLLSSSAFAFDGKRKGFVLGGGVGAVPVSRWSTVYQGRTFSENGVGYGLDFFGGYGLGEHNVVGVAFNIAFNQSDMFDVTLLHTFLGPSWQHYFGPTGKSFFSMLGVGRYDFEMRGSYFRFSLGSDFNTPAPPVSARGLGYLVGGGYEFSRKYRISGYLSGAQTAELDGDRFGNLHLMITLGYLGY